VTPGEVAELRRRVDALPRRISGGRLTVEVEDGELERLIRWAERSVGERPETPCVTLDARQARR